MDKLSSADTEKSMAYSEDSCVEDKSFETIPCSRHSDSTPVVLLPDVFQRHPVIRTDWTVRDRLRKLFEHCIQQVSHLEAARNQHIQELLDLHEPLLRDLELLRRELQETRRLLGAAQLSHTGVSEEVERVKRKLFAAARDCIQSQVMLATQKYEVAQSAITRVSNQLSGRDCFIFPLNCNFLFGEVNKCNNNTNISYGIKQPLNTGRLTPQ